MAVFSVSERGGDMVQETAVEPPARLPRGVVALSAAAGVLWCALAGLGGALSFSKVEFQGWHAVVGVVGLIAAGVCSANVAGWVERTYGQYDAGIRVAGVSAWAGIGTGATLCATSAHAADVGWWALLPGAVGTACLLRVPFAAIGARRGLAYVRRRRAEIAHLRRHGRRTPGVLVTVEFLRTWHQGAPEFRVEIASGAGMVTAWMVTEATGVPVVGSAVDVVVGGACVLVELGEAVEFEEDAGRWREPEG